MILTNNYHLPLPIYSAVSKNYKPIEGRYSVTDLINPPLIRYLKMTRWDDITEDASERLWSLLGKSIDKVLSENVSNGIVQRKIEIPIGNIIVVARLDLDLPFIYRIEDWKVTSVWSIIFEKIEWEQQLNIYAWAKQKKNERVDSLGVNAILRDWTKQKTVDPDYPRIPFFSKEIPLWDFYKQNDFVAERIAYHIDTIKKLGEQPIECTPEEKWQKLDTFAVMKKGRKSALRVLETYEKAFDWCVQNDWSYLAKNPSSSLDEPKLKANISIIERKGEPSRCMYYCPVRSVCPYAPQNKKG